MTHGFDPHYHQFFFVRIKDIILKMFGAYTLESVVVMWLALSARGHVFNSSLH